MKPRIALLVLTDGRGWCFQRAVASFETHADQSLVTYRVVVNDDAEEPFYQRTVEEVCPHFDQRISALPRRRGFGGAINAGWDALKEVDVDFVFHLEDDFQFERDVDLAAMAHVLAEHSELAQMVLRRQAWGEIENAAGGFIEAWPNAYHETTDGEHTWLEHRLFFSTNPCLYRASLCQRGWPHGEASEGHFSAILFEDPTTRCAIWGPRNDSIWVRHIGVSRIGTGY